jgi:hypothetical protein
VESISKAGCMQLPPESKLGARIPAPDARHAFRSLLRRHDVCHRRAF